MTQEVLLHVGYGKTGSSFLQSSLALSRESLAAAGIAYPIGEKAEAAGRAGHISSGNYWPGRGALVDLVRQGLASGQSRVLISSEALFLSLQAKGHEEWIELRAAFPGLRLRFLLFIRDPLDHAVSVYHQLIKRGGYTGSFADSLAAYRMPQRTAEFVTFAQQGGDDLAVRNYSRHSGNLLAVVEDWLGLPRETLATPPTTVVNRSLTLAELELQRHFNALFGRDARRLVSDPLCNLLPEIRSETPSLPREALATFLDRMRKQVSTFDGAGVIAPDEHYRVPALDEVAARFAEDERPFPFAFGSDQLRIVTEAIHAELQRLLRRGNNPQGPAQPGQAKGTTTQNGSSAP